MEMELQNGHSQRTLAEKCGVMKSTVGDIWKYCQKLEDCISSSESLLYAKKCCVVHEPKYDLVNSACWKWFSQLRAKGAPVSGIMLQEKALVFFTELHPDCNADAFKASTGWLQKFNLCHGIRNVTLLGKILSAYLSAVDPFREEL